MNHIRSCTGKLFLAIYFEIWFQHKFYKQHNKPPPDLHTDITANNTKLVSLKFLLFAFKQTNLCNCLVNTVFPIFNLWTRPITKICLLQCEFHLRIFACKPSECTKISSTSLPGNINLFLKRKIVGHSET